MKAAQNTNKVPLPAIKSMSGLRIPHDRSNFLQTNYRLRNDLVIINFFIFGGIEVTTFYL